MNESSVRVDKWLWAARFFKTRSLARRAIDGGKVHLNGHRIKPSRALALGDRLRIVRGTEVFEIEVAELNQRRGPAVRAQAMYQETAASREQRLLRAEQRKLLRNEAPQGRPDKRDRRRAADLKRKRSQT